MIGLTVGLAAAPLAAQSRDLEAAVGVAVPIEILGAHRSAGPFARLGIVRGSASRVARLRIDAEGFRMPGTPARNETSEATGDLSSVGVMGYVIIAAPSAPVTPYVMLGAGAHVLHIDGASEPTTIIGGVRSALGIRARTGEVALSLEIAAHYNLSDRGTGRNVRSGSYLPISFGVRF